MEVLISTCWMSSPSIFGYFLLSRAASPLTIFFFFNDPPTTEIYTLSLHDALPISTVRDEGGDPSATGSDPLISGHGCGDRKSTRLNSSHGSISYAVFCLKKKK